MRVKAPVARKALSFCAWECVENGQVSSEALVVLLAFFAVLSQLAVLELEQVNRANTVMAGMKTRAVAQKSAMAVDAMSANPGAIAFGVTQKCQGRGTNSVYCSESKQEASAPTIALKLETIQKGKSYILRLGNEPHYG